MQAVRHPVSICGLKGWSRPAATTSSAEARTIDEREVSGCRQFPAGRRQRRVPRVLVQAQLSLERVFHISTISTSNFFRGAIDVFRQRIYKRLRQRQSKASESCAARQVKACRATRDTEEIERFKKRSKSEELQVSSTSESDESCQGHRRNGRFRQSSQCYGVTASRKERPDWRRLNHSGSNA